MGETSRTTELESVFRDNSGNDEQRAPQDIFFGITCSLFESAGGPASRRSNLRSDLTSLLSHGPNSRCMCSNRIPRPRSTHSHQSGQADSAPWFIFLVRTHAIDKVIESQTICDGQSYDKSVGNNRLHDTSRANRDVSTSPTRQSPRHTLHAWRQRHSTDRQTEVIVECVSQRRRWEFRQTREGAV